jgi:transposase
MVVETWEETSRSIARVSRELRMNETTLGYWVRAYRERHAGNERSWGFRQARLLELKRRNRELEMENEAEPAVSSVS